MYFIVVLLYLPAVAIAQSLVLIGGNLKDDNVGIWTTMIEKAVSFNFSPFLLYRFN
jgi:hypothetical protein